MLRILIGQDNLEEASSGNAGIMTGSAPLSGIILSKETRLFLACLSFRQKEK
jgi:hypothetical protein